VNDAYEMALENLLEHDACRQTYLIQWAALPFHGLIAAVAF